MNKRNVKLLYIYRSEIKTLLFLRITLQSICMVAPLSFAPREPIDVEEICKQIQLSQRPLEQQDQFSAHKMQVEPAIS